LPVEDREVVVVGVEGLRMVLQECREVRPPGREVLLFHLAGKDVVVIWNRGPGWIQAGVVKCGDEMDFIA